MKATIRHVAPLFYPFLFKTAIWRIGVHHCRVTAFGLFTKPENRRGFLACSTLVMARRVAMKPSRIGADSKQYRRMDCFASLAFDRVVRVFWGLVNTKITVMMLFKRLEREKMNKSTEIDGFTAAIVFFILCGIGMSALNIGVGSVFFMICAGIIGVVGISAVTLLVIGIFFHP
jgi:hypothetical protein